MGRSELETPPELWVDGYSEEGGTSNSRTSTSDDATYDQEANEKGHGGAPTGRPDEEKLSMLSSIRSTFHKLLYKQADDR
jgi:hypothetical protein